MTNNNRAFHGKMTENNRAFHGKMTEKNRAFHGKMTENKMAENNMAAMATGRTKQTVNQWSCANSTWSS